MRTLRKLWNVFTTLVVAAAVLLAVLLVGVRAVGLKVFVVLSGSMEPKYRVGSLIYVKKADYTKLKPGDAITFMQSADMVVTHRIIEVVPDDDEPGVLRFRTKGDANEGPDGGSVHYRNVIGKPVFTIPKLGYFADYIKRPPGTYVAVCVGALLFLLAFLPDLFGIGEKKPEDNGEGREGPAEKRG